VNDYKTLAYIAKEIVNQRNTYETAVQRGSAKDYAEYKNLCGIIQGLTTAEQIINDLVQKMEKSDD
jgi:hypothetical protein